MARPLYDERFPLHRYANYLAADLSRRARSECGEARFQLLSRAERTRAIDAGLGADDTTRKLYGGAIFRRPLDAEFVDSRAVERALISRRPRARVVVTDRAGRWKVRLVRWLPTPWADRLIVR